MPSYKKLTKAGKYNTFRGTFYPLNENKFTGDSNPKFKSRLEQKLMSFLDKSSLVVSWNYENIVILYKDKTRNNSTHNYYMDFKVRMRTKQGEKIFLIEVKSFKETLKPTNSKRKKPANYKKEIETYVRNQCKWQAAMKSCKARGWDFKIFTEKELG